MQFEWEIFILTPVGYIVVDFNMLVSDLLHAGSALVEKREIRGYQNSPET